MTKLQAIRKILAAKGVGSKSKIDGIGHILNCPVRQLKSYVELFTIPEKPKK